jgi:hypothetical protein
MASEHIDGVSLGETTLSATNLRPGRRGEPAMPTQIGRYTVLKPLGAGGMGVVYAAYDTDLDRKVAIKLLHGDVSPAAGGDTVGHSRLLREAQAMAKISHPNVLQVYEAGTHAGPGLPRPRARRGHHPRGLAAPPRSATGGASWRPSCRPGAGCRPPTRSASSTATSSPRT